MNALPLIFIVGGVGQPMFFALCGLAVVVPLYLVVSVIQRRRRQRTSRPTTGASSGASATTGSTSSASPSPSISSTPGWYPDPSGQPQQRYSDGRNWTKQNAPGAIVTTDVTAGFGRGRRAAIAVMLAGAVLFFVCLAVMYRQHGEFPARVKVTSCTLGAIPAEDECWGEVVSIPEETPMPAESKHVRVDNVDGYDVGKSFDARIDGRGVATTDDELIFRIYWAVLGLGGGLAFLVASVVLIVEEVKLRGSIRRRADTRRADTI